MGKSYRPRLSSITDWISAAVMSLRFLMPKATFFADRHGVEEGSALKDHAEFLHQAVPFRFPSSVSYPRRPPGWSRHRAS